MASNSTRYPKETMRRLPILAAAGVVCLVLSAIMQTAIDPGRKEYHSMENAANTQAAMGGLNNEFMLLPLLGFREAAAGLLWVRCDEFFHSGDYDAILPLVRLITWLDPHADNVYVTGAWHLDYNFTDSTERSDRRYIAPALSLLDEGIKNNQNIPDIKFEKGWQCYDKVKDFSTARDAFEDSILGPYKDGLTHGLKDQDNEGYYPYAAPLKNLHMLAHTYEKMGRLPEAIAAWDWAFERCLAMQKQKPGDFGLRSMHDAELHNKAEVLQRFYNRYTTLNHDHNNTSKLPAVYAATAMSTGKAVPFDVALKPAIEVARKYVFKVSGRINLADGGRIDVRISDWDYKDRVADKDLRALQPPDLSQTILIDSIAIRKSKFAREMDMSRDPKMYSFSNKAGIYKITLTFNTRTTSPHIQDYSGWSAEGLTDSRAEHMFYDQDDHQKATKLIDGQGAEGPVWDGKTVPKWQLVTGDLGNGKQGPKWTLVQPDSNSPQYGQPPRIIRVTYKVNRDQVLGNKPITDRDIVPNDTGTTIMLK